MSKNTGMSRRQALGSLLVCAAPLSGALASPRVSEECLLENEFVEFRLRTWDGKVVGRRLRNKLASETLDLPTAEFALEFDNGSVVTPDLLSVIDVTRAGDHFELIYSASDTGGRRPSLQHAERARSPVEVRVQYQLPRHAGYIRKQIEVRGVKESPQGKLIRADLDNWMGVKRPWQSMHADRLRFGSHPIFCDTFWGGVEFVAAFNEYSNDGFILRSRPGGKAIPADWVKLRSTVTGVAEPGGARLSFMRYLEDVRLRPAGLVANYNSWWSLPPIFHETEFVPLMERLKERLYEKEGVFFDLVTGDMGWSDPRTIWKIDRANQPDDLNRMVGIVESAQGKPGLWMSPSEIYPDVIDYEWAKKNGYVVVYENRPGRRPRPGISLADPRYRSGTEESLKWLIKEKRLGHIKYDGFIAREEEAHHGLLPGDDSVEPLAEYSLELVAASRQANPDLVTEPTYLNSHANYISPWIIKYADSVWGNAGGDCPRGIGPAPDYRESHTNSREYYIFSSLNEVWLPQNALQYFDIVHCDRGIGFPNHAAMAFGRGRFFVPTYLDPKYMTDEDWRIYAGLLKWARQNVELLRNTEVLPSRVEMGEPYAYAHWQGQRGIVAVRNPSNESREFTLDLRLARAPKDLAGAVCYSQYPYRKGIATGISASTQIAIELAPWELVFLEIVPRSELKEPVAMNSRWYRDSSGAMVVAPPGNTEAVSILLPGEGEHTLPVKTRAPGAVHGEILSQSARSAAEADWLKQKDKAVPTTSFELECAATIPDGAKGTVLFLLEFAGREHRPSHCSCLLNGRPAKLEERSSKGHIGGSVANPGSPWKALIPYESEWTWYLCELDPGTSKLRFTACCGDPHPKVAVWAWSTWNFKDLAVQAGIACPEPQMPQYRDHLETKGIRLSGLAHG